MGKSKGTMAVLLAAALMLGGAVGWFAASGKEASGNYGSEMKMDYRTNYADGGANTVERQGDHEDSPYFCHVD